MIASRSPFLEAVLLHRLAILAVVVLRPVVRLSVAWERVANPIFDVAPHARREERGLCVHLGQAERDGKDRSGIVRLARGLCFLPRAADIRDEATEAGWLGLACDDERLTFVQLWVPTRDVDMGPPPDDDNDGDNNDDALGAAAASSDNGSAN